MAALWSRVYAISQRQTRNTRLQRSAVGCMAAIFGWLYSGRDSSGKVGAGGGGGTLDIFMQFGACLRFLSLPHQPDLLRSAAASAIVRSGVLSMMGQINTLTSDADPLLPVRAAMDVWGVAVQLLQDDNDETRRVVAGEVTSQLIAAKSGEGCCSLVDARDCTSAGLTPAACLQLAFQHVSSLALGLSGAAGSKCGAGQVEDALLQWLTQCMGLKEQDRAPEVQAGGVPAAALLEYCYSAADVLALDASLDGQDVFIREADNINLEELMSLQCAGRAFAWSCADKRVPADVVRKHRARLVVAATDDLSHTVQVLLQSSTQSGDDASVAATGQNWWGISLAYHPQVYFLLQRALTSLQLTKGNGSVSVAEALEAVKRVASIGTSAQLHPTTVELADAVVSGASVDDACFLLGDGF